MLFFAPNYGYLPAHNVRRVSLWQDEWSLIDIDGNAHQIASLERCVIWPPVPAQPGWQVVNAWPNPGGSSPEITLERLPVVAWQLRGNIADPVVYSRFSAVWALQAVAGGPLTVPGEWMFPDEAAFTAYAREQFRKRGSKSQSAAD